VTTLLSDRGARQRAGLTPAAASNTLSCHRTTLPAEADQIPLTGITVSTAIRGYHRLGIELRNGSNSKVPISFRSREGNILPA
jgi:hypothetical protein